MVGVAPLEAKMREHILWWFGHVYRRPVDTIVRRSDMVTVDDSAKGRGRPKVTLEAVVCKDLS